MGIRFRKSKNFGPFRINLSKSGIGYSVGVKGARITKKANGGMRTTTYIPGTGISSVHDYPSENTITRRKARTARLKKEVQEEYGFSTRQINKLEKAARRNPRKFSRMTEDEVVRYTNSKSRHGILFYLVGVPILLCIPVIGWFILYKILKN